MSELPKVLNNDGPGSMIIRDGFKPVAEMLGYTSDERDTMAAEFIRRYNALANIPDPAAYVKAFDAMREALEDAEVCVADNPCSTCRAKFREALALADAAKEAKP